MDGLIQMVLIIYLVIIQELYIYLSLPMNEKAKTKSFATFLNEKALNLCRTIFPFSHFALHLGLLV
jgi:hypothetical protein